MRNTNSTGAFGEAYAVDCLRRDGYEILTRNFSCRFGELDVIAKKDGIIAFVEVKSRAVDSLGTPAQAVTISKQRKLILTAQYYLWQNPVDLQPRFDVFEVLLGKSHAMHVFSHNHILCAFEVTEQNGGQSF